jgi:hypothetical protein
VALFAGKKKGKTMEISHQDFIATWERHFRRPVHPLAAALLTASKRGICLKNYDSQEVAWCYDGNVSFTIAFFLPSGADEWQIQLPSDFFVWKPGFPPSRLWMHDGKLPGTNFASEYAKWTHHPYPDLFCALDVTLDGDGVRLDAFFGGESCN